MLIVNLHPKKHNFVQVDDRGYFLLSHPKQGEVLVPNRCPHRGGPLHLSQWEPGQERLTCPWHGASVSCRNLLEHSVPFVRAGGKAVAVLDCDKNSVASPQQRLVLPAEYSAKPLVAPSMPKLVQPAADAKTVSSLLEIADAHNASGRYEDALAAAERVLALSPGSEQALQQRATAYRHLIPRWHFPMLNDQARNAAFDSAIAAAGPHHLVLDIGTGSGLLAMMAARAGNQAVVSCESCAPLAVTARKIVAENGFAASIKIVDKKSLDLRIGVDLPRRADLLVTEIVDCGLLGEGLIPTLNHAKQHLLEEKARMIPRAARVFAALVEGPKLAELNQVNSAAGFTVREFNQFSTAGYFPVRLNAFPHRLLTKPVQVFSFDFCGSELIQPATAQHELQIAESGACCGIVFWFELELDETTVLSNQPENHASHWLQAFQVCPAPLTMVQGQSVQLMARHDCTKISFAIQQ